MFRWYRDSDYCFAYLADVAAPRHTDSPEVLGPDFEQSRWFTRGWTLQELLAPRHFVFFDKQWLEIGSRSDLADRISARCNISIDTLNLGEWPTASVATKMSWAAGRTTTRAEDIAYCLLGLFGVNMPLLYGEGDRAFLRLQEEILKETDDHSIFAWDASRIDSGMDLIGALAPHPSFFQNSADIESHPTEGSPMVVTNRGIQVDLPVIRYDPSREDILRYAPGITSQSPIATVLECTVAGDATMVVAVPLRKSDTNNSRYSRTRSDILRVPFSEGPMDHTSITLTKRTEAFDPDRKLRTCCLRYNVHSGEVMRPLSAYPEGYWQINTGTQSMTLTSDTLTSAAASFRVQGWKDPIGLVLAFDPLGRKGKIGLLELDSACDFERSYLNHLPSADYRMKAEASLVTAGGEEVFAELITLVSRGSWIFKVNMKWWIRRF